MEWERKRYSPVDFGLRPLETAIRDDWVVALRYDGEAEGPWIADLSHRPKWDLQSPAIDDLNPWGLEVPAAPGRCTANAGRFANRMNRTQASLWDLGRESSGPPLESGVTDVTEGLCLLALSGNAISRVLEKLSPLDLSSPAQDAPFLVQGPVCRIPCQVVVARRSDPMVMMLAFSRGYGQAMAEALMEAGKAHGLRPCGESRFLDLLHDAAFQK